MSLSSDRPCVLRARLAVTPEEEEEMSVCGGLNGALPSVRTFGPLYASSSVVRPWRRLFDPEVAILSDCRYQQDERQVLKMCVDL